MENYQLKKTLPNKVNQDAIIEFLLHLRQFKRKEGTIEKYRNFLEHFFSDRKEAYTNLSSEAILQWFQTHQTQVKESTYRGRVNILSAFFNYCIQIGYMDHSPIIRGMKSWELKKTLPNKLNQEVVNEFLLHIKLQNYSEETIIKYRHFLGLFFINQKNDFSALSSEEILLWFRAHQAHVKASTYRGRLNVLSSFYNFCVKEEYMDQTPIKRRWFPRLPQPVPKYLEKEEIAKIRKQSENLPPINQVLVEFLLSSGCRVGEVHRLNRKDVNFENRTACVVGKGKKIRTVHFSEKCAILLQKYLEVAPKSNALFCMPTGRRMSIPKIIETIKKIGVQAEIETNVHPHRFRHTFATELLSKGADISFIKEELGHSDVTTTQIYARLPMSEIVTLYRRYMG